MSEYVVEEPSDSSASWRVREVVVRCRDCKYFASDELGDYCTLLDFEDVKSMGNGFCAWGVRRDA